MPTVRTRSTDVRMAGALLLLSALASAVSVVGRVAADADRDALVDSVVAISSNRLLYGLGGAGRFVSGVALVAAACYLARTRGLPAPDGVPLVSGFFAGSGVLTAVSGAGAVILALAAPDVGRAVQPVTAGPLIETVMAVRWLTGKIGFALAGLAVAGVARYLWTAHGRSRKPAVLSAALGLAMQFIWIDSATALHPIIGVAFFAWLVVAGFALLTGRAERRSSGMTA